MAQALNISTLPSPIDALGDVKARIAELKKVEKELTEQVKNFGAGAHEGAVFRASVSEVEGTSSLDPKAAEEKLRELGVDGRWFSKNQRERKGYVAVKISARKV